MSIESNLKRIADSNDEIVELLTASLGDTPAAPAAPAPAAPAPAAPAPAAPAPASPAPAPAQSTVPFSDKNGLMQYVMNKYKQLGPEKGAQIQAILVSLNLSNINDVEPAQFEQFYTSVEGIQ